MIGVISHPGDDHALAVMRALIAAGREVRLLDTADFPTSMTLTLALSNCERRLRLANAGRDIDLDSFRAMWWRRPQPYRMAADIAPDGAQFAYSECHEAMSGAWQALGCAWVNSPSADEVAHHKPYQLAVARFVGLTIPDTLITNDPTTAREFVERLGADNLIYKTFLAQEQNWRETRRLTEAELAILDDVRMAPVIFQEFVEGVSDLRITIFGEEIHATEIVKPPNAYRFDYRMEIDRVTMRPTALPTELEERLLALMRALGLKYGAIDMIRTADDRFLFLEVNPSGEFLFVEQRSGQPLADAMARLLAGLADAALPSGGAARKVA
jgi:glutathione synthase/RimK-type ligase-like ATP-grasp enzyme